jgi:hypothetical protein
MNTRYWMVGSNTYPTWTRMKPKSGLRNSTPAIQCKLLIGWELSAYITRGEKTKKQSIHELDWWGLLLETRG